jgi:putative ABC transport system substrate-binding protein
MSPDSCVSTAASTSQTCPLVRDILPNKAAAEIRMGARHMANGVGRRQFISALGGGMVAWPLAASAQQSDRMRRVGVLMPLPEDDREARQRLVVLTQALRQLGWIVGDSIAFEARYADVGPEQLPALAAELVHANVDVIITQAAQPIEAVRAATTTIPIVMASVGDAVGAGYVASLAHPGGNITGLTLFATDQSAKRLQLIKQISPGIVRIAVIWNGNASGHRLQIKEMERAVSAMGIVLQSLPISNTNELDAALRATAQDSSQAIVTMDDPLVQSQRARIVAFAMGRGIPVMGEFRPVTEAGGLMSYAPNQLDMWRRAASYIDKTLKGAKPADLPVEQPIKFELVINLKTAKALGISIPQTLLATADEVIE